MENSSLPLTTISSLDKSSIDRIVKINGEITRVTETPGLYILTIKDETAEITSIIFKEESINIQKGKEIEIEGQITLYEDKLEIIAKQIKNVD